MTIAFKPTASSTTIEHNGSAIATLDSTGLTMAAGKTIVGSGVGKILQVVSTTKTDTWSGTGTLTALQTVTGLTATITPSSTSSKILVMVSAQAGSGNDVFFGYQLYRGTTAIMQGNAAGSRPILTGLTEYIAGVDQFYGIHPVNVTYLDSPSTTSATTYSIKFGSNTGSGVYLNRTGADRDTSTYDARTASTITVMEVAG